MSHGALNEGPDFGNNEIKYNASCTINKKNHDY